jgi:hypothetical protein
MTKACFGNAAQPEDLKSSLAHFRSGLGVGKQRPSERIASISSDCKHSECRPGSILVEARREGDIQSVELLTSLMSPHHARYVP